MNVSSDSFNRATELILWIALNLIAAGVCIFAIGGLGSITGESLIDQIAGWGGGLLMMGGPLFIALMQWFSIYRLKISRIGFFWAVTGFASSLLALILVGISVLALGNYPTQTDYFYFAIMAVSEHYLLLGFTQAILWRMRDGNWKRASLWGIIHLIGFISVTFIAYHLIYTFSFNDLLAITGSLVLMTIIISISGMVLVQSREQEFNAASAG